MPTKTARLLLVDGNSVIHRAFHALPPLQTREGIRTNAVYGFATMLQKAREMFKPDYIIVAFDHSKVTFRNDLYDEYKGTRPETDPELRPQFALVKRLLAAWNLASCEVEGYEADDLIGTLSRQGAATGLEVLILTGDRDALQLVGDRVKVLLMRRGLSQVEVIDREAIKKNYGLEPEQLIDVKALMGDASDNIPGVPGVGEKTAVQLVRQYGDLEGVLAHNGEIKGRRVAENLVTFADQARLARRLATIDCQAPVTLDLGGCCNQSPDYEAVLALYKELEFHSLVKDVLRAMEQEGKKASQETTAVRGLSLPDPLTLDSLEELAGLVARLVGKTDVALELILNNPSYLEAAAVAVGLAWEDGVAVLGTAGIEPAALAGTLEPLLRVNPIFHDAKRALVWLSNAGARIADPGGDTMVAGYLLNPTASRHDLPELCLEHLNLALVEGDSPQLAAARRAAAIRLLHRELAGKLQVAGMENLYRRVELPLTRVLGAMESYGVAVDMETLDLMGIELEGGLAALTEAIYELAGEEFNLNSPKQLAVILFEKLGLPPVKRTKTGFSTDAAVLEELACRHPIAAKLVEYRQLAKLKSTYVDGLKPLVNPRTGSLHTSFNQTVTATGRLSSSEPNLQNIPVRLELGRRLRKAFVPHGPGRLLLAADYSQIELRILAHISGDEAMIAAFRRGEDIHARTAAEVFGVPLGEVTPAMRRSAKAVNFGIVYGISDYGLSRDLGISRSEAHDYIERYFRRYRGVKAYLEEIVARARQEGYVTTLLGRRRYLPDLFSSNRNVRSFGERTAMNTPIQGTAADIIKMAMVKIFRLLEAQYPAARMILQVHDELIFDVPEDDLPAVAGLVKDTMEHALELQVPLQVDLKAGPNWYDLEPYKE
ncbi:DNA polymerase I [Neomoorella thermoacetica]|uniref:DNA polymerase I n=1 Tax=Neomoorella thermoacetica TaxID=1525 RepID=UPI0008FAEFE7|nr:DNA polymerase I [Moorella thermoacetica]OIQ62820.1 DNA polymerase I [Moorella thermoacetica]